MTLLTAAKNSIDIPPNALAQVAASIEHKHRNDFSADGTGSPYHYAPGQAFKAARRRSHLQLRKDTIGSAEMKEVTRILEGSPRKMAQRLRASPQSSKRLNKDLRQDKNLRRQQSAAILSNNNHLRPANSYQALIQRPSTSSGNERSSTRSTKSRSSYETVRPMQRAPSSIVRRPSNSLQRSTRDTKAGRSLQASVSVDAGPRLQRSTSGLGFDDTSFDFHTRNT